MENTLKKLQELQQEAFAKGVHSFDITTRSLVDEDDNDINRFLCVYVFLKGDDSDEDYLSVYFYEYDERLHDDKIRQIKTFIGI